MIFQGVLIAGVIQSGGTAAPVISFAVCFIGFLVSLLQGWIQVLASSLGTGGKDHGDLATRRAQGRFPSQPFLHSRWQ
jgi:hypothetical protein